MGNFLIGLLVSIVIGIIIIVIILMATGKKKAPIVNQQAATNPPNTSTDGHMPPTGNAKSKTKSKFWSKFTKTLGVILLVVGTVIIILFGIRLWKKIFIPEPPKPHYVSTILLVEVRRKSIQLNSEFNNVDSIHMKYGEICSFNFASVTFCAKNSVSQMVCGPAYSDPDLPRGEPNQDIWLKSEFGPKGNIVVIVKERREIFVLQYY